MKWLKRRRARKRLDYIAARMNAQDVRERYTTASERYEAAVREWEER